MKKALEKLTTLATTLNPKQTHFFSSHALLFKTFFSTNHPRNNDEWNDAWEASWLPEDLNGKTRAPWETDVNFPASSSPPEDRETKAFVEEMNENWEERRKKGPQLGRVGDGGDNGRALYSLESIKRDYRVRKQKVHAGMWAREIERMKEEEKDGDGFEGDLDIDRLFDNCSEIFDTTNNDLDDSKIPGSSEFQNKPDGWEATAKAQDGSIWEMSQREEDILLQEFDRRIAYSKFQIASFIKSHIFSRRRPIDGWKYMIEVVGPNAKKGKGSVARIPTISDASTQPFKEERIPIESNATTIRRR